jgi:hypothetical protein
MRDLENPIRLKLDPWATSSLLQKAIRRGEIALAQHAAQELYRYRGKAIWRRLINIAFEDVGIADPALVAEVTFLASNEKARSILGQEQALIDDLCRRLADAPKDRSADYLFCSALKSGRGRAEQRRLATHTTAELIAIAADGAQPLLTRAAAGLLGCSEKGALVSGPLLDELFAALNKLSPSPLHDAVTLAADKRLHSFLLMVPLLWSSFSLGGAQGGTIRDPVTRNRVYGGIPLYAFDKHTAVGKQAISQFAGQNEEVKEALATWVPAEKRQGAALMAAFYTDAIPVARRFDWTEAHGLYQLGLEADMAAAGVSVSAIPPLLKTFRKNLQGLDRLREDLLRKSARRAQ